MSTNFIDSVGNVSFTLHYDSKGLPTQIWKSIFLFQNFTYIALKSYMKIIGPRFILPLFKKNSGKMYNMPFWVTQDSEWMGLGKKLNRSW